MKNKNIIIISIVLIFVLITVFFLYKNTGVNKDVKLFNSLNQNNLNKNICEKIENTQIKEKCFDNYYSINAFNKNDELECEKITNNDLKNICKKEIQKYK